MSTIIASNISDGTDTVGMEYVTNGAAKSLAQYNQSANTVGESFNVTSITDQATGDFEVNYTNNMATATHITSGETNIGDYFNDAPETTKAKPRTFSQNNVTADSASNGCLSYGDLA